MSALTGKTPASTYPWLMHVSGPGPLSATVPRAIVLGDGTATPLSVTTTKLYINGTEAGTGGSGGTALTSYATQIATLADYPLTFPPAGHQHSIAEITDIADATVSYAMGAGETAMLNFGTGEQQFQAALNADSEASFAIGNAAAAAMVAALNLDAAQIDDATGSRELVLSDAGKYIRCTHGTATAIAIPNDSSVAWPAGTVIIFRRVGGPVTVASASGAGVTIEGGNGSTVAANGTFAIRKTTSANYWELI